MSKCVIVGGADINNYAYINEQIEKDDFLIFCDSGLRHKDKLNAKPSLIVGDFDSYANPNLDIETIILPCEKDDTDTVFAAKEGIKRGYDEFLIIGAVGARMDHTLVNVYLLTLLNSQGKTGKIIDDYSEMELITDKTAYISDNFSYFSLVNITGNAQGVTIKNAKYNLTDAEINCDYQYATSNEVQSGKTAEVSVKNGKLLLIKVF